jgi:hypothetical protein
MKHSFLPNFQRDWISDAAGNGAVQTAANAAIPGSGAILGLLGNLFGSKPNPNDWKGWDAQDSQNSRPPGTSVAWWIITDGDSVQNEALNAISYMRTKTQGVQKVYEAAQEVYNLNAAQFTAKLVSKLNRAGYASEAAQFAAQMAGTTVTNSNPIPLNQPQAATPIAQSTVYSQMPQPPQTGTSNDTTSNTAQNGGASATDKQKKTWTIIAIVGGVIILAGVVLAVVKLTDKGK